jgi:hypothetical protein
LFLTTENVKKNRGQENVTEKEKLVKGRKFKQLRECRLKCKERTTDRIFLNNAAKGRLRGLTYYSYDNY